MGQLLNNLKFSLNMENQVMGYIMQDGDKPATAARKYLTQNPDVLKQWLKGVKTVQGEAALPAVQASLGIQ